MSVRGEDRLAPGKGADEHEQAGLGQVEVGEKAADEAEFETG